jgi:hypothetical protein
VNHAGCGGRQWRMNRKPGKCETLPKEATSTQLPLKLASCHEDSCQIWVFRRWKTSFVFFLVGNLLFLKHCVGQIKHVCGLNSVCGLPFWALWFTGLTKHDISVPICNLEACYFQAQFIFCTSPFPSLLGYLYMADTLRIIPSLHGTADVFGIFIPAPWLTTVF